MTEIVGPEPVIPAAIAPLAINLLHIRTASSSSVARETEIAYTIEAHLRGFYTIGPVCIRIQDTFGLFHNEREIHLYDDFLVFPKMEDIKDALIKSRVPKIFTGAVNIRNPGEGSNFYNLREYVPGDAMKKVNWKATARSGGK